MLLVREAHREDVPGSSIGDNLILNALRIVSLVSTLGLHLCRIIINQSYIYSRPNPSPQRHNRPKYSENEGRSSNYKERQRKAKEHNCGE
jgi:hypothetical protein